MMRHMESIFINWTHGLEVTEHSDGCPVSTANLMFWVSSLNVSQKEVIDIRGIFKFSAKHLLSFDLLTHE